MAKVLIFLMDVLPPMHLFPQKEECTSSSGGDNKMYTFGSIANSQRMLSEINKSGVVDKIRI